MSKNLNDLFGNNPIARINLKRSGDYNEVGFRGVYGLEKKCDPDFDVGSLSRKIMVEFMRKEDECLCDDIIEFAKKEGISTLYLIDREFVMTALRNEVERRKQKEES